MSLSTDHNHSFGSEEVRRYILGEMSPSEMHAFEKAMQEDPFLEDAVEGMRNRELSRLSADAGELRNRLAARVDDQVKRMPVPGKWWRYAAAAAVIVLIGITTWFFNTQYDNPAQISKNEEIREKKSLPTTVQADSGKGNNDTSSMNLQQKVQPITEVSSDSRSLPSSREKSTGVIQDNQTTPSQKTEVVSASPAERKEETREISKAELFKEEKAAPEPSALILAEVQKKNSEKENEAPQRNMRARLSPSSGQVYYFIGKVTDSLNRPIPFANISTAGNNSLTYTDAHGNFRMMVADSILDIQIKSIGYSAKKAVLNYRMPVHQIFLEKSRSASESGFNQAGAKKPYSDIDSSETDSANPDVPEAEPADGWGLYHMYLLNNIRIPRDAELNRIQGTVIVSFMVNTQGWLYNFRVDKSLCPSCDREAIRLIREGPRWVLYNSDDPVRTSITVVF